jgi:hypothetical protein
VAARLEAFPRRRILDFERRVERSPVARDIASHRFVVKAPSPHPLVRMTSISKSRIFSRSMLQYP